MTSSPTTLTPSGLATVALLKTRFDQGLDHLDLFEPFVADALNRCEKSDFIAADIKEVLHGRTGLFIPIDPMQTLLNRFVKKGYLQRLEGRYIRTNVPIPDPDLDTSRRSLQQGQARLGAALLDFLSRTGLAIASADDALVALATFVADNKVHLLLESAVPDNALDRSRQERKLTRAIAQFISELCLPSAELGPVFVDMVEGILLKDTILLRDVGLAPRRLDGLTVVLDSGLLFDAIGMTGVANNVAATEGLHLLRAVGVRTIAFDKTVAEMRRILSVYEHLLATPTGSLSLYPTDLTRHALDTHMSPSDMRLKIATLEEQLRSVNVTIREVPRHEREYTLDETSLQACLVDPRNGDRETKRIHHDVDCIAGVLTLRRGSQSDALERARFVFATTSGRVVRSAQAWYRAQGQSDFPPIIHYRALTSIAWLKKPAAAPGVMVHELAALCAGAIRPSREVMDRTLAALRTMMAEGVISSDEAIAVAASALLEPLLAQLDDETDPDADTIADAIARVRRSYRDEAATVAAGEIQRTKDEAEKEKQLLQAAADKAAREREESQRDAEAARRAALEATKRSSRVHAIASQRADVVAGWVSAIGFWGMAAIILIGALVGFTGVVERAPAWLRLAVGAVTIAAVVIGCWLSIRGGSLLSIKRAMGRRVRAWALAKLDPTQAIEALDHSVGDREE